MEMPQGIAAQEIALKRDIEMPASLKKRAYNPNKGKEPRLMGDP